MPMTSDALGRSLGFHAERLPPILGDADIRESRGGVFGGVVLAVGWGRVVFVNGPWLFVLLVIDWFGFV